MQSRRIITAAAILGLLSIVTAAAASDDGSHRDRGDRGSDAREGRHEDVRISVDGGSHTLIIAGDDADRAMEIDLSALGGLVGEALSGMDETLAGLSDLDLNVTLDEDGLLTIDRGEDGEIAVDVAVLAANAEGIIREVLGDLDLDELCFRDVDRVGRHDRGGAVDRDTRDIENEIDRLQAEVDRLERELKRLQRDADR